MRDTLTRAAWLGLFDWFALSMRMQAIPDSSFACPGSAPILGGKKAEFRDWTNPIRYSHSSLNYRKKGQLAQLVRESDSFFRVKRQIKIVLTNVVAEHVKSRIKAGFHQPRSQSRNQKGRAMRSSENQPDGVRSRTLHPLMTPSLTI